MRKILLFVVTLFFLFIGSNYIKAEDFIATKTNDKVMYIKSEDGSFLYSWTFDKNINNEIDFDLGISFKSPYEDKINMLDSDKKEYVSFNYHGNLPGVATIKVPIKNFKDNSRLKLYYYNDKDNKIELISDNVIVKNGYVTFEINHCSDYFFKASVVRDVDSKNTGGIAIVAMIIIIVALLGYTLFKKN